MGREPFEAVRRVGEQLRKRAHSGGASRGVPQSILWRDFAGRRACLRESRYADTSKSFHFVTLVVLGYLPSCCWSLQASSSRPTKWQAKQTIFLPILKANRAFHSPCNQHLREARNVTSPLLTVLTRYPNRDQIEAFINFVKMAEIPPQIEGFDLEARTPRQM